MAYILFDDFNDNSIDTSKWDETDPNGRIAETSQQIEVSNPHTTQISSFVDYLKSDISISSGVAVVQGYLTWTTDSGQEAIGGIYLYVDNDNYAGITSRDNEGGGHLRISIKKGGGLVYNVDTGLPTKGKDVKIVYDMNANEISFWYWNGSSWAQMGTTQTQNLGSPVYYVITAGDNTYFNGANPIIVDNAYFSSGDYSTRYPPAHYYKTFTDNATLVSSFTRAWTLSRAYSEAISLADSITKGVGKTLGEAISLVDSLEKAVGKLATEIISLIDSLTKRQNIKRVFSDALSLVDTFKKGWRKILTESLSIKDMTWQNRVRAAVSWFKKTISSSTWTKDTPTSTSWTQKRGRGE